MAVIKLTNKAKLDQLLARLTLQTGHKPTQQEILNAAVDLAEDHFDELQAKVTPHPIIDDAKILRIRQMRKSMESIEWIEPKRGDFPNEDDADIYSV